MPTTAMNQVTDALNFWGARFAEKAGPMLVQSMEVAVVLLTAVWACSRTRAAFRYGLLMLVLVKLLLPPSLSLPTGLAYWLEQPEPRTQAQRRIGTTGRVQTDQTQAVTTSAVSADAIMFLLWIAGIGVLSALIVGRYRKVVRLTGTPAPAEWQRELDVCRAQMGMRRSLRLETSSTCASPAVCGLFRPVILIPTGLAEKLTPEQLRHVLLHELGHVRRGDLWINHLQVVLQVIHWFNPLLWLANGVIRRVREEAVDDLVMTKLGAEAQDYPATLVSVARMAFARSSLGLGFIGIMESKAALKRRVTRLVQNPVTQSASLGWARTGVIVAAAAVLLPMARPKSSDNSTGQREQATASGFRVEDGSGTGPAAAIRSEFARALQAQEMTYEQFREKFVGNRVLKPGELEDLAKKWMAAQKSTPQNNASNTVARIVIQQIGPPRVSEEQIKSRIGAKVGEPVSRTQVDTDVRSLYLTGLFFNVRVAQDQSPEGTVLTYIVQAKPRLEKIVFEGNTKIGDGALREKLTSRAGDPLDERKLFNDAQTIQDIYQRLGFPNVGVKYKISNDEKSGRSAVAFQINEKGDEGSNETPITPKITVEGNVTVWDVATGRKLQTPAVTFSSDGKLVATGNNITLWDAGTGRAVATGGAHSDTVSSVIFSPDGKSLILSNRDGTQRLWEVVPGKSRQSTNSPTGSPGATIQTQTGIMSDPQFDPATVTGIKDDAQLRK